jgi:ribosome-associated protein
VFDVTNHIRIPESEFHWSFVRASGPGGQNVNKVASKAVLRWNVTASPTVPQEVKDRLGARWRNRITPEGNLILTSQRFRDQDRNRQDCLEKLREMIREAAIPPKPRKATRPTRGSRENRLRQKRRRSQAKVMRRRPEDL